jgi:CRP/FNR family transcriptional regulator, cyclic AMP receptor protein
VPIDVFAAIPDHELRALGRRRTFARDEVVFHRDDPGDSLHRIDRGRFAARIVTPLGEVATVAVQGPGEVFGLFAVLAPGHRRTATVVALEHAETLSLAASDVHRLRRAHPEITEAILELLTEEVAETSERLVEALYTPASRRVTERLRALAELYADRVEDGRVVIPLSQEHLAGLAGSTRETVNRVLKSEQQRGRVDLGRNRITVDLDALRSSATRSGA